MFQEHGVLSHQDLFEDRPSNGGRFAGQRARPLACRSTDCANVPVCCS